VLAPLMLGVLGALDRSSVVLFHCTRMAGNDEYTVDRESVSQERLLNSGVLGLGVVTVIQLLQLDCLGVPLWVSLVCFATSLPMLSMNIFILSMELVHIRMPAKTFGVRTSAYAGPIIAYIGISAVFWHFHFLAAVLFIVISLGVLFIGGTYTGRVP
jgi:hypothetical protein